MKQVLQSQGEELHACKNNKLCLQNIWQDTSFLVVFLSLFLSSTGSSSSYSS